MASTEDGTQMEQVQIEAAQQSKKLQEAIYSQKATISEMWGVLDDLREVNKMQTATNQTIQEVHKADSARIHALEASPADLKHTNLDLVAECKAAAPEVAQRIPSGDTP